MKEQRYEVLHEMVSPGYNRGEVLPGDRFGGNLDHYLAIGAIREVKTAALEDTGTDEDTGTEIGDADVTTLAKGGKGK